MEYWLRFVSCILAVERTIRNVKTYPPEIILKLNRFKQISWQVLDIEDNLTINDVTTCKGVKPRRKNNPQGNKGCFTWRFSYARYFTYDVTLLGEGEKPRHINCSKSWGKIPSLTSFYKIIFLRNRPFPFISRADAKTSNAK